jgi:hypothetical protein
MQLLQEHRELFERHAKRNASMPGYTMYCAEVRRAVREELLSKHKGLGDARKVAKGSWTNLLLAVRAALSSEHASKITSIELRGFTNLSDKDSLLKLKDLCQMHGESPRLNERFNAHHAAIDNLKDAEKEAEARADSILRLNRSEFKRILEQNYPRKVDIKNPGRQSRGKKRVPAPGQPIQELERQWPGFRAEQDRIARDKAGDNELEPKQPAPFAIEEALPEPKKEEDDPEAIRLLKKVPEGVLKTASNTAYNMLHGHSDPRKAEQLAIENTRLEIMRGSKLSPEQAKVLARHLVRKEKG